MKKILFTTLACILFSFTYAQNQPATGLLFDDDAYEQTPVKARNVAFQDVVSEQTNASLKEFVPEIKNQGGYGTCVGWSSAYYGRTILNARIEGISSREEITKNAFSPVFTYLHANVDNDYNCQGGAYINRAMETMVEIGSPFFKDYDVMCDSSIPEPIFKLAGDNKIKDFTRLFGSNDDDDLKIESVKRSLINGNPVVIGFIVENSLYTAKNVFEPDYAGTTGGHAMCVVGYDDDKYGGAFEIVNSWGKSWGNDGFIWVRYSDFSSYAKYAFEMIPAKKKKTVVKSQLAGELNLKLYDGSTMQVTQQSGKYKKTVLGWQDVVLDESSESIGDYATSDVYGINTRYRMYAKVNKPAYVYVVGADSNNDSGVLFPHKEEISPYISYENTSVVIPGERYWFRLNSDVASDYSIVIFSEEKIDIQEVKDKMDVMEGELLDKLYVIFNDKLISKDDIQLNKETMGFTAEYTKGSMALMILDIKRR
ncbi:MAG: C1 family peptidase [Oceanihabitans sp.]